MQNTPTAQDSIVEAFLRHEKKMYTMAYAVLNDPLQAALTEDREVQRFTKDDMKNLHTFPWLMLHLFVAFYTGSYTRDDTGVCGQQYPQIDDDLCYHL